MAQYLLPSALVLIRITAPFRLRAYHAGEFGGIFRKLSVAISTLGLVAGDLALRSPAHAQGVQVGALTCNVAGGFGFILGSSRAVNCIFAPAGGAPQHYTGSINKFGVDIGYVHGGGFIWPVVAPTAKIAPGSLAGTYAGVTGSATVGVGLGANVLMGGSANSIALQPVSIQGTTGLNVAAGVATMTLTYNVPRTPSRIFAGPTQYPPTAFAAYGIVAFRSRATSDNKPRHEMICRAYVAGLLHSTEVQAPQKRQMVTIWPIEADNEATRINAVSGDDLCPDAVRHYGLLTSSGAITSAQRSNVRLDGRGPFLLAWSPAEEMGKPDAKVLVSDLSGLENAEQAEEIFRLWSTKIQQDPELWSNGWSIEKFKLAARFFLDKYGPKLLQLFGIKEKA
jgi:hypothetical protein